MKMVYGVTDKPTFGKLILFAVQQLLAIMAATLVVPVAVNNAQIAMGNPNPGMSSAAALFGAGAGTLVYTLITKRKSPVFLGSSFAFLGSMASAFAGASSVALGYAGVVLGAMMAGLCHVIISIIVKYVGVNWVDKVMPPIVIGPTVATIGLSLASGAVGDLKTANGGGSTLLAVLCGVVTILTIVVASVYGKKFAKLIPFILGILAGYAIAAVFTAIGSASGNGAFLITDFSALKALTANGVTLKTFISVPDFAFIKAFGGFGEISGAYIAAVAVAYIPVSFVVLAEHIADHKNISSIIETDLLKEPGLKRTLMGDGFGSITGSFFGGCATTTYGESIACVAISGNASVATIITASVGAMLISFISPFVAFVNTIPSCVMGGACVILYGFIAVSGFKMIKNCDLDDHTNIYVISTILIIGIGGLTLNFGKVSITAIACALILGIIVNLVGSRRKE